MCSAFIFFFFNDTATTEIYTLSLHDALPISCAEPARLGAACAGERVPQLLEIPGAAVQLEAVFAGVAGARSEEHTSELQSRSDLVCRLLLEKKNKSDPYLNQQAHKPQSQSRC